LSPTWRRVQWEHMHILYGRYMNQRKISGFSLCSRGRPSNKEVHCQARSSVLLERGLHVCLLAPLRVFVPSG
jgi:hypothetical protein